MSVNLVPKFIRMALRENSRFFLDSVISHAIMATNNN
jgi:hypothetical protein